MDSPLAASLALASQLSGFANYAPTPVPAAKRAPAPEPRPVSSMLIAEVASRTGAALRRETAGRTLEFSVRVDPDERPRVVIKEDGASASFSLSELEAGATAALPGGPLPLRLSKGTLAAGAASVTLQELLQLAYDAAAHVEFPPVTYALLLESAADKPQAVATLRRDSEGIFWLAYHPVARLSKIEWLLSIDGTLFGMRLDGSRLTFWSKPLPPLPKL